MYKGKNLLKTIEIYNNSYKEYQINNSTTLADVQQEFKSGRSCIDVVFVIKKENLIQYNKPA